MLKKVLGWIAVIVAVLWIVNSPGDAADLIRKVFDALATLATSLS